MLSKVAGYYTGAYPIPELMKLKRFSELLFWYRIMEREIVEKNILNGLGKKPPPTPQALKRMVDKKLKELKGGLSE